MEWLELLGYPGLLLAAFLAATLLPMSSEGVLTGLLLAGYDPVSLVAVATAGNWLGGLTSYGLGYLGRWDWLSRYLRIQPAKAERAHRWVRRYGAPLAAATWLPVVGDLWAVALGLARVRPVPVAAWMLLGKGLRYAVWAWLSWHGVEAWG